MQKEQGNSKKLSIPASDKPMKIQDFNAKQVSAFVSQSNEIGVFVPRSAGADGFCAAVGLYRMLKNSDANVRIIYQGNPPESCSHLITKDEITSNISQRELEITIDYSGTPASKANYTTENDVLRVTLGPVHRKFNLDNIKTRISGFDFDLVFMVGVQELRDLGTVYDSLKEEIETADIVNIDNSPKNMRYAKINVIDAKIESLSMLVYSNAPKWELKPDKDSAQALLTGISL